MASNQRFYSLFSQECVPRVAKQHVQYRKKKSPTDRNAKLTTILLIINIIQGITVIVEALIPHK